ncbi:hypothetical protein [Methanoplanus limicola]|uniref:CHAT domain-containing protein n=1 Tax=Methanoplanus limicola DSM 2279 TaxID=937775 RepID=H1Z4M0_9EURY|nr:hypothetical protein [Methanoplanus limicola]EHQ36768.1 hypothetical protein Metlim_2733 [Methanoplanus limicola DSM 2279]
MKLKKGVQALSLLLIMALMTAMFVPAVSAYQADAYGFSTNNPSTIDTTQTAYYVDNKLAAMGYNPSDHHYNNRALDGYSELEDTDIFFFSGHSSPGRLQFGTNSGGSLTFIFADGVVLPRISEMPSNQLYNLKLAVFLGCNSGEDDANLGNLVEEARGKNAKCVIGFMESVSSGQADYWAKKFYDRLDNRETIRNAFDGAWRDVVGYYGIFNDGGIGDKTIDGDENQIIDLY